MKKKAVAWLILASVLVPFMVLTWPIWLFLVFAITVVGALVWAIDVLTGIGRNVR